MIQSCPYVLFYLNSMQVEPTTEVFPTSTNSSSSMSTSNAHEHVLGIKTEQVKSTSNSTSKTKSSKPNKGIQYWVLVFFCELPNSVYLLQSFTCM